MTEQQGLEPSQVIVTNPYSTGFDANQVTPVDIYGTTTGFPGISPHIVSAPKPNFPGMNPNAPTNIVSISSNPNGANSSLIRVQFNCASANFKFEQSLERSSTVQDIKDSIKRMNINSGKTVSLHYNNVARQDSETLATIGYIPGSTVELTFEEAEAKVVENPNPFNVNYPDSPVKCATPVPENIPPKQLTVQIKEDYGFQSMFFILDNKTIIDLQEMWYQKRNGGKSDTIITFYNQGAKLEDYGLTLRELGLVNPAQLEIKF